MKLKVRDSGYYGKSLKKLEQVENVINSYNIPLSVRQIFYRLVDIGVVENTKKEYENLSNLISKGRYTGDLDWDRIIDDTRGAYKTTDWSNLTEALKYQINNFRRDRWANSEYYIEAWVEKRTMIRLFYEITDPYDVRLISGGGFNSTTAIWEAVKRLIEIENRKIIILYFGDLDPSGWYMSTDVNNRLKEFGLDFELKRILLNSNHIEKYNLKKSYKVMVKYKDGSIENKLKRDARSKLFYETFGELFQIEVEALDPDILLEQVENSILQYYDRDKCNKIKRIESREVGEAKGKLGFT